jgi:DNA-binding NarL/FixJ family response regulator
MCRTLIVENSVTFRKTFSEALGKRFPNMVIEEAEDGAEAMRKIRSFQPQLVFMDIRLPGENGLRLTGKIKSRMPELVVIILTDYDLEEYRSAAFLKGADDFIAKGALNLSDIEEIVQRLSDGL